jgi:16S rRNA (cytosine967-C5)-methyltransferase
VRSGARLVAYGILRDVTVNGAYAALSVNKRLSASRLTGADRRLAAALAYDTLENQYRLDFALDQFLARKNIDPPLRDLLRLGACQILLYGRVPDSAAVNETVGLCDRIGLENLKGVVNGVLRNLIRGRDSIKWPDAQAEPVNYLSIMYSIPEWLVERLITEYGRETAFHICTYRERGAGVTLRPNMLRLTDGQFETLLTQKAWTWRALPVPRAYEINGAADIGADEDHIKGWYSIQGAGSMLAAMAVGARNGWHILDCCAAPGGKAAYLAESMGGTGRVYAWDLHPHRVDLIHAVKKRLKLDNIRPAIRDAMQFREDLEGSMDAVLVDAPCSGYGVMLKKPDVKYRHQEEDIQALCLVQAKLLETCSRYVKRGGVMVYATCTLLRDENQAQVEAFLKGHPDFRVESLPDTIPEPYRTLYGPTGMQLLTYRDGTEGFFIARMRRAGM